ncbi:MAG: YbaK/EbsC family protein [Syntrophobacterales bacterium]|jgi:Ala-tRNA(Pro) deacylase
MLSTKLMEFLDKHKIKHEVISHSLAYTAQEIAASAHIPGKKLAKTVIVRIDGNVAMAVLPASYRIDLKLFKNTIGARKLELLQEEEFKDMFPDCDIGAMPPFGNLYDMEVLVAESLAEEEEIAFNAGCHTEVIKMAYKDYESLVKPKVMKFSFK